MTKLSLMTLLIAPVLLGGCGYDGGTTPPAPVPPDLSTPTGQVGIPASYQPGVPMPGEIGAPALTKLDFPTLTHTKKGDASDPVNVMVAGSEAQVRGILSSTGWQEADPITVTSAAKMAEKFLSGGSYPTAPMSDLYLYNRVQDFAYEKDTPTVRSRDHLRIWQTPLHDLAGDPFWAIATTRDVAVKFQAKGLAFTHQISPDIDSERTLVMDDFMHSGIVAQRYALQSLPIDDHGMNGGGDEYFTDGRAIVLELR